MYKTKGEFLVRLFSLFCCAIVVLGMIIVVDNSSKTLLKIDFLNSNMEFRTRVLQETINVQQEMIKDQQKQIENLKIEVDKKQSKVAYAVEVSRGGSRKFVATAYTPNDPGCGRITSTGTKVKEGRTISVDPHVIPLGSKVYIESSFPSVNGVYIAEDSGGAIKGNKIDVFMEDYQKAMDFGRREITVRIESA